MYNSSNIFKKWQTCKNSVKFCQKCQNLSKQVEQCQSAASLSSSVTFSEHVQILKLKTVVANSRRTIPANIKNVRGLQTQRRKCKAQQKFSSSVIFSEKHISLKLKTVSHQTIPNATNTTRRLQKTRKTLGATMLSYQHVKCANPSYEGFRQLSYQRVRNLV